MEEDVEMNGITFEEPLKLTEADASSEKRQWQDGGKQEEKNEQSEGSLPEKDLKVKEPLKLTETNYHQKKRQQQDWGEQEDTQSKGSLLEENLKEHLTLTEPDALLGSSRKRQWQEQGEDTRSHQLESSSEDDAEG